MAEPQAPKMPGMPPSPSGGGGESSTAPPAGAADAAAPETFGRRKSEVAAAGDRNAGDIDNIW